MIINNTPGDGATTPDTAKAHDISFPAGSGELATLIRTFDWSQTSLGPMERWPASLIFSVNMIALSPVPMIILWGPDGVMIYNDGYAEIAGNRHPHILGKKVLEAWPEVADFNRTVMEVGLRGGKLSYHDQHLVLLRNGKPEDVWLDLNYSPILDERGTPAGVIAIVVETTSRVKEEQRRKQNELQQAFLLALSDHMRGLTEPRAIVVAATEALGSRLGISRVGYGEVHADGETISCAADWTDGTVDHFIGDFPINTFGRGNVDDLKHGLTTTYEDITLDPRTNDSDSTARFTAIDARAAMAVPLIHEGRLKAVLYLNHRSTRPWQPDEIALVQEIADRMWNAVERARAEEALRNLNASLERQVEERTRDRDRIWNLSQDAFMVSDTEGHWLSVSPAWTQLLGWSATDFLGRTSEWMEHPEDRAKTRTEVEHLAHGNKTMRFENRFRHKDGSYRWFAWTAVPSDGLLYCVARDVTVEKERQAELEHIQELLRQSQKMEAIGQLTGGIAHDFNNLLTSILAGLDLLQRRVAAGRFNEIDRYITTASASARRAAALTHRLLAFSRRQSLDVKPIDINDMIISLEDLLRRTMGEDVQFETILQAELYPALTDVSQIENALLNLCINARDAMPHGGKLTVETANTYLDETYTRDFSELNPGDYVVICVSDTGTGMPADVIERAFDPFFTTKPIGQGTGLGLSMIYGFVKQSGGHVRMYSEVGRGTTVKLYLPCHLSEVEITLAAEPIEQPRAQAGESVLIVEDDPGVRMIILEILYDLGYAPLEAEDATTALPQIESGTRIDLLITDVGLPGMNGRQLAEIARQQRPELPILFVTGYAEGAVMRGEFLDRGMEMISKPFAIDTLATKIRTMIGK